MTDEMVERFEQRTIDKGFGEYPPGDPRIAGLIEAAYNDPTTANHGVFIGQLNVDLRPKGNASTLEDAIDSVEFTTDAIGAFGILCSVACGIGHPHMVSEGAFVVK